MKQLTKLCKFAKEGFVAFHHTGSFFPTSKWAAKELTTPLRLSKHIPGRKILELGPGTGSVTVKILSEMTESDELTICEINHRFMEALQEILAENLDFQRHKERVRFLCCPAQGLPEDRKYDIIVCALPFLNFNLRTVREIFEKIKILSTEHTVMTYYEYMGLKTLNKAISPRQRRIRILKVDSYFRKVAPRRIAQRHVWLNLLPINVYTLKVAA